MKNLHLFYNTHWDREWRWSFRETQMRLVQAMDTVINAMEKDKRFYSFHTDSQASMVEDYLEMRPENRERVKDLAKDKRLMIGPWYTLPALFLVSNESIIRNLLVGHKIANDLGGVMKAAYNIFSWGQISQLPQIYRQFGMDTIMFYRGLDKEQLDNLEFIWEAPDGSKCLGVTFGKLFRLNFWGMVYKPFILGKMSSGFDENLGFLSHLCDENSQDRNHHLVSQKSADDYSEVMDNMEKLIKTLEKAVTDEKAIFHGFDLDIPDPLVPDLVDYINEKLVDAKIIPNTLPDYFKLLKEKLTSEGIYDKLPVLKKEMLEVEKKDQNLGPLYAGVFSARMPIKLQNANCEAKLMNEAEPYATMASFYGYDYPKMMLYTGIKTLLKTQQHDGIGGCHVDRVTKSSMELYNEVIDIANIVTRRSLENLMSKIDLSNLEKGEIGVVVFNPSLYDRNEVAIAKIDIPVSSHSAFGGMIQDMGIEMEEIISCGSFDNAHKFLNNTQECCENAQSNKIETQVISIVEESVYFERTFGANGSVPTARVSLAFNAGTIPSFGFKKFRIKLTNKVNRPIDRIIKNSNKMENEYLMVEVNFDGTLNVTSKVNGEKFVNLAYYEDTGEIGGPLKHLKPTYNQIFYTLGKPADISIVDNGPLFGVIRIVHRWELPEGVVNETKRQIPNPNFKMEAGLYGRSDKKVVLTITTDVKLRKTSDKLEVSTKIENTVKNHRLRVLFPIGFKSEFVYADAPFDVMKRKTEEEDSTGWYEEALMAYPSSSFVNLTDETKKGFAVIHNGISEYEVYDKDTLAFTLLRCFDVAGGGLETHREEPLAQCLGLSEFKYDIVIHDGKLPCYDILKYGLKQKAPVKVVQSTVHSGEIKEAQKSFVKIDTDKLVVSSVKQAEEGLGTIIRFWNPTNEFVKARLSFAMRLEQVAKISLEEKLEENLDITINDCQNDSSEKKCGCGIVKNEVKISVKPKEIYTLYVRSLEK